MPVDIDGGWTIPTFVAEAHYTDTAIGTSFNISTPSGVRLGDYMLMFLVTNKDTITKDAAFTLIQQDNDSANPWSMVVYSRVATSSDVSGDTYTWNLSAVTPAPNTAVILAYRGVDQTNVIVQNTYTSGTTNPVSTPNVTLAAPSLIVTGNGTRRASGGITTWTGSGTERFDGGNVGTVSYQHAYYDSGSVAYSLTSQGANSIQASSATNLSDRMGYTVALPARKVNPGAPSQNLIQAIDRASRW